MTKNAPCLTWPQDNSHATHSWNGSGSTSPLTNDNSVTWLHLLHPHRPIDFAGGLKFFHMFAEGRAELGGEDCLTMGLDALFDLLDGVCQLFDQLFA